MWGFHTAMLMEIEHGRLSWGDSFTSLEIRAMAGCLKGVASAFPLKELKRNAPTFYFATSFSTVHVPIIKIISHKLKANRNGSVTFVPTAGLKTKPRNYIQSFPLIARIERIDHNT